MVLGLSACGQQESAVSVPQKVDVIYTNGNIYTVNEEYPWATTMAVKDGKFVYVGDEDGAKDFEGPSVDLKGQFVMPGIVDSHTHIAWGSEELVYKDFVGILGNNKSEVLANLKKAVNDEPNVESYRFVMRFTSLNGEKLTRDELDEICPDKPLVIVELEQHSRWLNTLEMKEEHIDEYAPDVADGLSYCERDEDGRINGRIYEWNGMANTYTDFSKEVYENGLDTITDCWKKWGIVAAFDAGQPSNDKSIDTFFNVVMERDAKGNMPYYIEGCYYIYNPNQLEKAIENLKKYDKKYNSEHLRARTMKIMMDGTMNGHTAAIFDNFNDVESNGATLFDVDTLTNFVVELNNNGIDLHVHTVGERAVATVLDAVENAQTKLGNKWKIQVTCAHIETIRPQDIGRFAKLGVIANFTPAWFGGNCYENYQAVEKLLGKNRASKTYRAASIWNTGAIVDFSSDSITLKATYAWNPYLGIETGLTRQTPTDDGTVPIAIPDNSDKLSMAQLIKGYTITGAKQMRIDDKVGSIEVGKDASFLVFEQSLFDMNVYDIHNVLPKEFYIRGILQK